MEKIRITDREMKNRLNIIVLITRILVGGIMIYASLDKIIHLLEHLNLAQARLGSNPTLQW